MSSVYDDPEIRSSLNSDFVKFENVGDSVVGTIVSVGKQVFPDGKVAIKYVLATDDGERVLTAGQVQLAQKLYELRPDVGDKLSVKHTAIEKRQGGKTLKHFEVKTKPGEKPAPVDDEEEPF